MKKFSLLIISLFLLSLTSVKAQVGEPRSVFSLGGNAGYVMSNVSFIPRVTQGFHGGYTAGLSLRYTCEKYFSTICSVAAEVNYAQLGWKENILTTEDKPVIISGSDNVKMAYQRTINYIQVPVMAHLAWGKERKGVNGFINLGPQFGLYMSESTDANFDIYDIHAYQQHDRASVTIAQDTMKVENKFDYGIAAGAGIEFSHPKIGHFILEGRYYYGLGNMYGDSKRDYFGRSNFGNIVIKATYLFDISK